MDTPWTFNPLEWKKYTVEIYVKDDGTPQEDQIRKIMETDPPILWEVHIMVRETSKYQLPPVVPPGAGPEGHFTPISREQFSDSLIPKTPADQYEVLPRAFVKPVLTQNSTFNSPCDDNRTAGKAYMDDQGYESSSNIEEKCLSQSCSAFSPRIHLTRLKTIPIPTLIDDYNNKMGRVNQANQLRAAYTSY